MVRTLSLSLLLALVLAVPAPAATISRDDPGNRLVYNSGVGEADNVNVFFQNTQWWFYRQGTGAALVATGGCTQSAENVNCPFESAIDFFLNDGHDTLNYSGNSSGGTIFGGEGDDTLTVTNTQAASTTVTAGPGNDTITTGPNGYGLLNGNQENDTFKQPWFNTINGGDGTDTVDWQGQANAVYVTLDDQANDGIFNQATGNTRSDVENILGGGGADQLTGDGDANLIDGGPGGDQIRGNGGSDTLRGGPGNDTVHSRDGVADNVECGGDGDLAIVDPADTVSDDCESVQYADDDGDGSDARADCDDSNPAVKPGAPEVPGNGVDDDCAGGDAPKNDLDGDGVNAPTDCNDSNAAIKPGATDVPGNGVDEDCAGGDAAFPLITSPIGNRWQAGATTKVLALNVTIIPAGARVTISCKGGSKKGCAFKSKTVTVAKGKADMLKLFKKRRLKPGVVIEVRITAPNSVGKVARYKIRKRKLPSLTKLCLRPGAKTPHRCT